MATSEVVSCEELVCGYEGKPVVRNVSLVVRPGQIVAILGGSGSGKSTLLKTLVGLLPPIAGSVRLLGEDPYSMEPDARRRLYRRVGMLYQGDALFGSMSVLENVSFPLMELTRLPRTVVERAARARLALVDLSGLEHSPSSEISGGQSKRAALARATILDPDLLFCDEPTSGLDSPAAAQVDSILLRFRRVLGMAVVAVTHDVESVRSIADRAIVLGRGVVAAEGKVLELERSPDPRVQSLLHRKPKSSPSEGGQNQPWLPADKKRNSESS